MQKQIEIFLFVLSSIYLFRFILEFLIRFRDEVPKPMEISSSNQIFIYLAVSYIITFLIT